MPRSSHSASLTWETQHINKEQNKMSVTVNKEGGEGKWMKKKELKCVIFVYPLHTRNLKQVWESPDPNCFFLHRDSEVWSVFIVFEKSCRKEDDSFCLAFLPNHVNTDSPLCTMLPEILAAIGEKYKLPKAWVPGGWMEQQSRPLPYG